MEVGLRVMRYAVAVADEGSFQAAATRLHIAQPPLSRQIAGLERELGVRLFSRRPTRLTEPGRVFVDAARRILADAEKAVERTRQAARGQVGTLRFGYTLTAGYETVPELVAACAARHPGIAIESTEIWAADLELALRDGRVDAAVGSCLPRHSGLSRRVLRRERLVALVARTHRLAGRPSAGLADFRGSTFTFFPRHLAPGYYDAIRAVLDSSGEEYEVFENPVAGLRHLSLLDNDGFTLVPRTVGQHPPDGTVSIPLDGDDVPTVDLELLWRRGNAAPVVQAFAALASELAVSRGWLA
jgi:DNA-binding transcriptional LysR family regulator